MYTNIYLNRRVILFIFLSALILSACSFVYIVANWRADWQLSHHQITPITTRKVSNDETLVLVNIIPKAHLFGEAMTGMGNMPLSNLQFHLTGIVHSGTDSKAYIAISTQASKIYRTGDQLPYGAKIFAITNDTVVLQNDGHLEKITLPRQKLEFKIKNKTELS